MNNSKNMSIFKVLVLVVCIILAILSLFPFVIMLVNSTRSTNQIQQHAVSLIPSKYFFNNLRILTGKSFNPAKGFMNSLIISCGVCVCSLYFSTLTAYALVMYEWKLKNAFFGFIMGIMMIPATVTIIGFFQMVYKVHMTNHLLVLILPAIASPSMVFFMRQYMKPAVSVSLVESARIDGSKEFWTFNTIVLPIMKPAIATQAIFTFVTSWNDLFRPSVILTSQSKYTLPIMVSLLNGDIYKREHGAIYVGLSLTALPLIVVYFILAKYIVAGVALGSVKG
ncbi:MAG: carbohydrate ABC transporter permease [Spirochaetia bacterium]|nr:carbohydrate ABC transporter permease [Spirochaetia bacterium]